MRELCSVGNNLTVQAERRLWQCNSHGLCTAYVTDGPLRVTITTFLFCVVYLTSEIIRVITNMCSVMVSSVMM